MKSLRILPVTVMAMVLVFALKLGTIWTDASGDLFQLTVTEVNAEEKGDDKEEEEAAEKPAVEETAAESEGADEGEKKISVPVTEMSESEIEVLQRLVERRDVLEKRSDEQDMRDNLLRATEGRIDQKISRLKEIEATIQDLLKAYDKQELEKLKSIVSIYEKMKPKDAARIFNTLDLEVLLDVTGLMKESKLAIILGNMDGGRAQELTVELATRKQLPEMTEKDG